ncbi:MAG TPA: SMC-Scp complex subunit ScpB [Dokdonella sp.]|uniref:SMC-Scp complex subunit ScpB n=1 Tax=Dokdonella sp. TaxID=2291710 RepID=UPI002D1CE5B2|nr:SMC-Scp complex subunit ScpB [Dokdonella sp.]HUD40434.1 SMC-Scp complex subunit ScpB [Dokdonella sp.]
MNEPDTLKRIVEAALLAASNPLSLVQLAALFPEGEAPGHDALARTIEALQADCAERGVELIEVSSGFRYQVRQDVHPWISRLWTERPARYTRALLETLALIAYRQPITRAEIEQIRGVAVSSNIVRTLEEREWIRVVGHRDVPGRPALFGTTRGFLDYFNLKSLDELPPLSDLHDIDELDPQLALAPIGEDGAPPAEAEALAEAAGAALAAAPAADGDDGAAAASDLAAPAGDAGASDDDVPSQAVESGAEAESDHDSEPESEAEAPADAAPSDAAALSDPEAAIDGPTSADASRRPDPTEPTA